MIGPTFFLLSFAGGILSLAGDPIMGFSKGTATAFGALFNSAIIASTIRTTRT
jgi:hypothetical protein